MDQLPVCMTIAGSDSGAGAGIQADLKTFASLGCYGTSVITTVTAQNTTGVSALFPIPTEVIRAQLQSILKDFSVSAIKIGMVYQEDIIKTIAEELSHLSSIPIILDPVLISSSGQLLLKQNAMKALQEDLFPLVKLITPNIPELEALTNPVSEDNQLIHLGKCLLDLGPTHVLIKGGHAKAEECKDIFIESTRSNHPEIQTYTSKRIITKNIHGTGCTLSSAIAAYLSLKYPLKEAIGKAKEYVTQAILHAQRWSLGKGTGPLNHFFEKKYEYPNQ